MKREKKAARAKRVLIEAVERRVLMSAGQLDPSFGAGGTVVIGAPSGVPITSAIAVGVDGRSYVADTYGPGATAPASQDTTIVTRYDLSGTPDPTFGVAGTVTLPGELVNKVLIRPAGPIDLVGSKLQQLTVTGAVQANFASGGLTLSADATSVALQSDGKLLITGPNLPDVMRFNLDGSADNSFASSGVYPVASEAPLAVALDSSGRIILGTGRVLTRLTSAGVLDTTFGTAGTFTGPSLSDFNGAHFSPTKSNIAVGPNGTIYLFSGAQSGLAPTQGGVDALFVVSSDGNVGTEIDPPTAENIVTADGLAIQADGKVLLLATTDANQQLPGGSATVLRRYMPVTDTSTSLVLDTTFNSTGEVSLNLATHVPLSGYSLAVDDHSCGLAIGPNGGEYFVETAIDPGYPVNSFVIARAEPDPTIPDGTASIQGRVFSDTNGDGIQQAGEPSLPLYGAFLDNNNNGVFGPGDVRAYTDASGNFYFYGLTPGNYRVMEIPPTGEIHTDSSGDEYTITISAGSITAGINFGLENLTKFSGTVIGTPGSWHAVGNTITNAFDGNLNTFYDSPDASNDWVGLDLGTAEVVTSVQYAPRPGYESRMVGGEIQGSNDPTFGTGVVTLATIGSTPADDVYTPLSFSNTTAYRYYRYLGPANSYDNVAELAFYG